MKAKKYKILSVIQRTLFCLAVLGLSTGNLSIAFAQTQIPPMLTLPTLPTLPNLPELPPLPTLPAIPELFASDTLIIKFTADTSVEVKSQVNRKLGGRFFKDLPEFGVQIIKVPKGQVEFFRDLYTRDRNIIYAEPDYIATTLEITTDPSLPSQWGMYKIKAVDSSGTSAFNITHSNSNVKIAILDTGIEETHPDLQGKIVGRANFSTSGTNSDLYGHGTHVAGIASASTNNALGMAGVGFDSSLMNVKVLGDDGSGYYSSIINGIKFASDNGADVINMSIGGPSGSFAMQDAINYAWNNGVVVVAAAGNDGRNSRTYPAYYSNVIAVAATDSQDSKASFSNYGSSWVDVTAPGVGIYSTYKNATYANLSGTSMATPFVAGLAGLIFGSSQCALNNNGCVRTKIESTADAITGTGSFWAKGRINALKALGGSAPLPVNYQVSVNITGQGSGIITSSPAGINCGIDCTESFSNGTQVVLTATPNANSIFTGWGGVCSGSQTTCTLTIDSIKSVSGNFDASIAPISSTVSVKDITMWSQSVSFFYRDIYTKIVVRDSLNNLVAGVTVTNSLQLPFGSPVISTATTNTDGSVTFRYRSLFGGTFTSTVTNLAKNGYIYDSLQNTKSNASLLAN